MTLSPKLLREWLKPADDPSIGDNYLFCSSHMQDSTAVH